MLIRLAEYLIIPPTSSLILIVLGLLLMLYFRRTGYCFMVTGVAILYLASIPAVSTALIQTLQSQHPALRNVPGEAGAIAVLAGGRYDNAKARGGDVVNHYTLERLRRAAHLHQRTGLPVIASGGVAYTGAKSGAALIRQALKEDFDVPVRWLEERSANTYENALYSAKILKDHGIDHVLVVTHAWHMPRAIWSFAQAGIKATPAPTPFNKPGLPDLEGYPFVPRYQSLAVTGIALHEWLGLLWYRLQYGEIT